MLQWAEGQTGEWLPSYMLALIDDFRGNDEKALARLQKQKEKINFAPFYIIRARLNNQGSLSARLQDVSTATELSPGEWRYGRVQSKMLIQSGKVKEAIAVLKSYYGRDKSNYIIGLDLVKAYMQADHYQEAEKVLSSLHILPFEGASESRRCYREIKLMLAHQAMEKGKYHRALEKIKEAEAWPARLGVGKPYAAEIDNDLENYMRASIYQKTGEDGLRQEYIKKVGNEKITGDSYLEMIESIASKGDQRMF